MTQPTPTVTAADVERIVRRDVPADRAAEVLAMLDEYSEADGQTDEQQRIIDSDWRQYEEWLRR